MPVAPPYQVMTPKINSDLVIYQISPEEQKSPPTHWRKSGLRNNNMRNQLNGDHSWIVR